MVDSQPSWIKFWLQTFLWEIGWWESKARYLSVWVGLRKTLVSKLPWTPLDTFQSRKGKCLSFSRSRMNWIDGSTEFKCDRRRSASIPDTAKNNIIDIYFPEKVFNQWSGWGPFFHFFHYHLGNDSRDERTHSCTKNLLIVGYMQIAWFWDKKTAYE